MSIFRTAHDVTLQDLMIESFFPADDFTVPVLRASDVGSAACDPF